MKNLIKYLKCLPFDRAAFVLNTTSRSGTHWFRHIFINYLFLYYEGTKEPITFLEIEKHFPNAREYIIRGIQSYKKPHPVIKKAGYRDFVFSHGYCWYFPTSAKKVLFLYRNPLDYIVSRYFYVYKNRIGAEDLYTHPSQVIDKELPYYIQIYKAMRDSISDKFYKISYEALKNETQTTMVSVLDFLSIPTDHDKLAKAIEFSTLKQTREEESKKDFPYPKHHTQTRYRSGKVGEWKEYLSKEDVSRIEKILNESDIYLSEFEALK